MINFLKKKRNKKENKNCFTSFDEMERGLPFISLIMDGNGRLGSKKLPRMQT